MSMSSAAIPTFEITLGALSQLLDKADAYCTGKKVEPGVLLGYRLAPDMFALTKQVQIACDMATRGIARLAGVEPASFEDNETTFAQVYDRIERAIAYVQGFTAEQIDGSETRAIHLKMRSGELHFEGQSYLLDFVLPNVFFHCTTAYNILREAGTDIGKQDFIGRN